MLEKLGSRKFWVTVFTVGLLVANGQYSEVVAIVLAYLGIQGWADIRKETPTLTDLGDYFVHALGSGSQIELVEDEVEVEDDGVQAILSPSYRSY